MPSKTEDLTIEEAPTSINPYTVLNLARDATADQIKTAYRKAALKHHPDKASADNKESAHTQFQAIAFAYAILSDPRRRSRYDTTGRTEESLDLDDDEFDWATFYREQFADVITGAALERFRAEFKDSGEERAALFAAYTAARGDMDVVYEEVMLSNPLEDEERFRKMIDEGIEEGQLEGYKAYVGEKKAKRAGRMKRARKEEAEAMEMAEELGVKEKLFGDSAEQKGKGKKGKKGKGNEGEEEAGGPLAALIAARQKSRGESFLERLEAKYAPKGKGKGGKGGRGRKRAGDEMEDEEEDVLEEPPEEAFEEVGRRKKAGKNKSEDPEQQNGEPKKGPRRSKRSKT